MVIYHQDFTAFLAFSSETLQKRSGEPVAPALKEGSGVALSMVLRMRILRRFTKGSFRRLFDKGSALPLVKETAKSMVKLLDGDIRTRRDIHPSVLQKV